jgi:hypothetical protein
MTTIRDTSNSQTVTGRNMTDEETKIFNDGMALGWKMAWKRFREMLKPLVRNTREKMPKPEGNYTVYTVFSPPSRGKGEGK